MGVFVFLVRARMAESPEQSDHTSIKQRIAQALNGQQPYQPEQQPDTLFPFAGNPRKDMPDGIPFNLSDYLELVDWSGRIIREDKKGIFLTTCQIFYSVLIWMPGTGSISPIISSNLSRIW